MKYKSTLARGLSHAWPWTKPIGSSPTASRLLRYSLLCMLILLCGGNAWAQDKITQYTFEKVTSNEGLVVGEKYIIVCESENVAMGAAISNNKSRDKVAISIKNSTIISESTDIAQFTLGGETNAYTLSDGAQSFLALTKASNEIHVATSATGNDAKWKIDVTKSTPIESVGQSGRYIKYNNNNSIFRCYASGQKDIVLYKLTKTEQVTPKKATTITLSEGYTTSGMEGTTIDLPTATVMAGETAVTGATVNWSSSDEEIATIGDGVINLLKPGNVTITASFEEDDNYLESENGFELTVTESPEIANPYTYTFEEKVFDAKEQTKKLSKVNWALKTDGNYFGYDGTKGQQFGSGSAPAKTLTLSTSDIPGTITSITIKTNGASNIAATIGITVGGTAFKCDNETTASLTSTATDYTFTGSASGDIIISYNQTSSKAIYIKSIVINYSESSTPVTPDPLYILGVEDLNEDNNTWSLPADMKEMTWDAENKVYTYELNNTSTASFCFSTNNEVSDWGTFNSTYRWAIDEGDSDFPQHLVGSPITLLKVNGTIKLPAGTWTISIATNDTSGEMGMTITGEATATENTYIVAGGYKGDLNPINSFDPLLGTRWKGANEKNKMTKQDNGTYKLEIENATLYKGTYEFKIVNGDSWIPANNIQQAISETGIYNAVFTFNPDNAEESALALTKQEGSVAIVAAGGFGDEAGNLDNVLFTTTWQASLEANKLTEQEDGTFTKVYEKVALPATTINYKIVVNGNDWVGDSEGANLTYGITEAGNYNVTVTYNPITRVAEMTATAVEVTNYNVKFAAGDGVLGVAPAAIEVEAGSETTAPKNTSLYKEGYTLIGWESGNEVILPGAKFTPKADMELTAKFGVNEVSLADREEDVTITYVLDGYNDAPKYNFQSGDGIIVTQATVNEKTIDVAVNTNGMFANNNSGWTLVNKDTKVTVPSCKGATIKVTTYQNANALNFGETAAEPNANPATYTATAEDETLVITQTAQGYWSKLEITLPKVESTEPGGDDVSGVFFSANVIATEVQNFAAGTTEITSAQATIVGGKMYAISAQETEKALINKQNNIYYFSMTNNNTYFKVELDHALAVGDVITADANGGVKNNLNKGLWVSTSDGYPTTAPACAGTSETESIITNLLNYTIQEGDEYVGKKTLYIYRAAGATEYFGNLKITRPASDEPSETNLKEKAIIDTDFQDWAKSSETTMVTTKYTKENITFTYSNATVDPEATNEGKFPTTTDAAYKGYIMSAKSEATITTTTFASISKIRYRHGATGNNRGWGLKMKVGDGEWEIVSDATVGSTPAWIEKTIDKENVQLQWYNLNTTQNAYMFELEVYAKVDLSNSPLLATLKANGTTYTAEDIFEMGTDDNYAATIELASSEAMPSAENPVEAVADNGEIGNITYETSNDQSVVTILVTAGEASVNYVATFVRKPNFTLTYYNLDGEEIGTQQVEKDAKIGEFAYDIANVAASKEGYKARGWFKNNYVGEKWTTESVITADAKLYAVETEIEVSSDSKRYEFDLTDKNFDADDHEAFNPTGNGKWHDNQHGWAFADGDKLELLVGGKASIILGLCQYSADVKISASNDESVDAKVATDGATATIEYEGEPGTLTLNFKGTTYLHKLTIFNTTTTNYEVNGDWIIVKEGNGSSLVDALFAAKEGTKIFLPNGTYDLGQKTLTTIGNNKVSIIGESMEGVIIKNRPTTEGIAVTATLLNTSTGLYMQDLTLDCVAPWSGSAERGVTLQDKGNQTILKNVYLKGLQDTYYSNNQNGTYYFEDGKIEGSVDYVCGNGDVYFNKTTFYTVNKSTGAVGGCIAAPNTLNSFGYIFNECTLDGAANEDGKYRLGRPWAADTKCLFVNTTMKIKPVAEGWGDWSPANPVKQFAEYNSKDAEENVISLDGRKNLFNGVDNNPVLTEAEAEALAPDVIFNGEWKPQVIALQIEAPVAELKDGVITWEKVDGATAYALFNNGSLMAIVDGGTTSYTIESAESGQGAPALLRDGQDSSTAYTIRAANGRGGFGEPKIISMATGIKGINAELNGDVKIYDMQGRQVKTTTKGVYIINGKKVVIK